MTVFIFPMVSNSIDYGWIDDVGGGSDGEFRWALDGLSDLPPPSCLKIDRAYGGDADTCCPEKTDLGKRSRNEDCAIPKSKACREKMRRDRLNDKFGELSAVLDPGKPPKSDKAGILADAARALVQLRNEAEELKDANEKLQDTIKNLKEEKNELRDDKLKLKANKDRLEQQMKMMSMPSLGFITHPAAAYQAAASAAFASHSQAMRNKNAPYPAYPAAPPTWQWLQPGQWLPPAAYDIGQDQNNVSPTA